MILPEGRVGHLPVDLVYVALLIAQLCLQEVDLAQGLVQLLLLLQVLLPS